MRAQSSSVLAIAASILATSTAVAQVPRPVPVAPAVAPNVAAAPAAIPPRTVPGAGALPSDAPIALREAPKGTNPVLAAFTPRAGGLTANDVAVRAVATSDTIAAKNAELRAAAFAVDSAMYQFYPKVALKASYTRLSPVSIIFGSPTPFVFPVNAYSLGGSLGVPISDYVLRLSDTIDATKRNRESIELNLLAERQKVEADARVAFFNWAMSIGQVAITEKSLERVQARQKDAQTAFTLGSATKADVLRMQALVASTEAGLEASRAFKQLAEQQLAVIMDLPPQEFALGEDVLAERSPVPLQPVENLVQEANASRYELKALDKAADSMRSAETVIRRGMVPRIDGFADYAYASPNPRYVIIPDWKQTWDVGLAATWNLNEIFINNSSGNEIAAKRQALEANRKAMAKGIRMEVTSAYTDARRSVAELEAAKRGAEASQAAYDTEVELFKVGKATTTELIESEAELVNALLKLISAHIDTRMAETKIARATGHDMHTLKN